jgi:hypothetical protein
MLHVDLTETTQAHATLIALGVVDGFLQALSDAFKCAFHVSVRPFQIPVNTSTKSASSLRSALAKLALSPLANNVSK